MKKQLAFLCLLLGLFVCGLSASAAETDTKPDTTLPQPAAKQPLDQLLGDSSIIPYPFYGNAFVNGKFSDSYGNQNYRLYQQQGHTLAPVRLVADVLSDNNISWQTDWQPETQTIQLRAVTVHQLGGGYTMDFSDVQKTATIVIGKSTMLVNGKEAALEVPAQIIGGYTVLPLRSLGEALDKKVAWVDNTIIFSNTPVDPNAAGTKAALAQVKPLLQINKQEPDEKAIPIAAYKGGWYSKKTAYSPAGAMESTALIYTKDNSSKTYPIGGSDISYISRLGDSLYYAAKQDNAYWLYRFDFDTNQATRVCSLSAKPAEWSGDNGWLVTVKEYGKDIYIILHDGDNIMGLDNVYRLNKDKLERLFSPKSTTSMVYYDNKLFYTEHGLDYAGNNLHAYDLATGGSPVAIGKDTYDYDIHISYNEHGPIASISTPAEAIPNQIQDGYLYLTGYDINAGKHQRELLKLDLQTNQLTPLSLKVKLFWLWNNQLVYVDGNTGHLKKTDLNGKDSYTLVKENINQAKVYKNDLYYTIEGKTGLYHYHLTSGKNEALTDMAVSDYFCNKAGVFAINDSAQPGIYKLEGGNVTCLDSGFIQNPMNTEAGVLYNKKYETQCFLAK